MKSYETYLFDVDGTLIDTAELIFHCFEYSCKRFADVIVTRDIVMPMIGLPYRPQLEHYIGPVSDDRYHEIFAGHMEFQIANYHRFLRAFDGISELLEKLSSDGKKLGIVTSRKRDTLMLYLDETGLTKYFDCIISPEDTTLHKPSPEPVLEALRLLDRPAHSAIYIGDSVYDIESGNRAGCDTAFVSWSAVHAESCHSAPTWVVDSPMDLLV